MFKVGDNVCCLKIGKKGCVSNISTCPEDRYPLSVTFENGNREHYTSSGMFDVADADPSLIIDCPAKLADPNRPINFNGYDAKELDEVINYAISHGYKKKIPVTIEEIKKRGGCSIVRNNNNGSISIKAISFDGKMVFDYAGDGYDDEDLKKYKFVE